MMLGTTNIKNYFDESHLVVSSSLLRLQSLFYLELSWKISYMAATGGQFLSSIYVQSDCLSLAI